MINQLAYMQETTTVMMQLITVSFEQAFFAFVKTIPLILGGGWFVFWIMENWTYIEQGFGVKIPPHHLQEKHGSDTMNTWK